MPFNSGHQSISSNSVAALLALLFIASMGKAARADLVYRNDFEGTVGPEWSARHTEVTPSGGRGFLGEFGNDLVSLHLDNLPRHNWVTLSFDLYVLRSWDGTHATVGPDVWSVGVAGGPTLLRTTFSNGEQNQAFPDPYPGGDHAPGTGAAERNTLGYEYIGDSVYRLTFTFQHSGRSVDLQFAGTGLEPLENEAWGLDNVAVAAGTAGKDRLVVSTRRLNFGAVPVGQQRTRTVRLRNRGREPITGNLGYLLSPFSLASGTGAFTLPGKGSLDVQVRFAPSQPGAAGDTLVITSNDPGGRVLRVPARGRGR